MSLRIYVASSWRNKRQPTVVDCLAMVGYHVYDFRNPEGGDSGFHWGDLDPGWESFDMARYTQALGHKVTEEAFAKDMAALRESDAVVLVLPCGASAHLEAGWAAGAGKHLLILLDAGFKPELMYKMGIVCTSIEECVLRLREIDQSARRLSDEHC